MLDDRPALLAYNVFLGCVLGGCLIFLTNGVQAATSDSATLEWAANVEPDLAGYRIYHGTAPGIYGLPQTVGKTTIYQYPDLAPNKTHYFTLTAFDASGNESLPSPEVSKYIADSSVSDPLPPSSLTISNLTVASGKSYVVPTSGLQAGGTVYIDRAFTFTTVPTSVQGAAYIQTANDDKAITTANFLSFNVNIPVTVYVAHDARITTKPSWLSTFTDTSQNLMTSDTTLRLFARDFSAGTITLGGNASGGGFSMYAVAVQPQEGGSSPDTTPPTIALTAPANGASVSGTIPVSATATDNIGVVGVQFRLNGNILGAEDTISPFSFSWNTSGVTPGPYILTAIARDAAGNTTTSAPITVTVLDITPPFISLTSPNNGSTLSGTVTIKATASDNIGVVGVQFQLNGDKLGVEDTTDPFSLSWDTTTVPNGSYTLRSTARDAAGNTTTSSPITVTVSNPTKNSSSLTISKLTAASGKSYVVPASGLQTGSTVYIDRAFTFTTVPTSVQSAAYIQTANDDKAITTANFLSFNVNIPVTVYVAHDARITTKPSWLSTFTDTSQNLMTSDTTLRLFARDFSAGTITLGGNASGGGFSMYAVIVQPQEGFTIANLTVVSGKSYVVPASGLQAGSTVYLDRSYTFSTVPAGLQGAAYIQTANDDKNATTETFLSFAVNQPVTVYVAHDARITTKPAWLSTFTDTGKDLLTSDTKLRLFARSFSAGTITLGGNAGGGFSMYAVIVQPQEGFTIANLTVVSGKSYVVPASGLQAGSTVYLDRSYTFSTVPAGLQGAAYIQTANDDKNATTETFLSFAVNQPVTVYVAHDARITTKPAWLSTFTDTGKDLLTSDTKLRLFARSFSAGTITLGGNAGGGFSMYAVIVQP